METFLWEERTASSSGRAAGYAAVVDNVTNDGIAVMAESLGMGFADLLLDGVAHTPGSNGTYWRTDARLFNPNSEVLTVSIESLGVVSGSTTISRVVPAKGLLELVDILGPGGFGYPEGSAGALRFQGGQPFFVAGRTSNLDPLGQRLGTYSAYQQAIPFDFGLVTSSETGVFTGLQQGSGSTGYRTNLAFLAGDAGASASLTLRDSGGNAQKSLTVNFLIGQWIWYVSRGIGLTGLPSPTMPVLMCWS
ncbi:MAG: hypothetical protein U0V70_00470 [Terriglobia bacterium]